MRSAPATKRREGAACSFLKTFVLTYSANVEANCDTYVTLFVGCSSSDGRVIRPEQEGGVAIGGYMEVVALGKDDLMEGREVDFYKVFDDV